MHISPVVLEVQLDSEFYFLFILNRNTDWEDNPAKS
jgi:hypothetical protein